jgi:hypothetical protein
MLYGYKVYGGVTVQQPTDKEVNPETTAQQSKGKSALQVMYVWLNVEKYCESSKSQHQSTVEREVVESSESESMRGFLSHSICQRHRTTWMEVDENTNCERASHIVFLLK